MKVGAIVAAALVGGSLVYGGMQIWRSPLLQLKTVEVEGIRSGNLTDQQIRDAAGVAKGSHLLDLSTDETARRIEARIPRIRAARVERVLPSKLRVTVEERKPLVVVVFQGGTFLADRSGVVFDGSDGPLVHVTGLPGPFPALGGRLDLPAFRHAIRVVEHLPPRLRARVTFLNAPTVDTISFELKEGTVLIYGAAEKYEDKNFSAQALLEKYENLGQKPATIDVRVPLRPAVTLK